MRKLLLTIVATTLPALTASAEQPVFPKPETAAKPGKLLPLKGASANSCAAFGPGFVKIAGSDTCMKVGGYVSSGASAYMGAR